MKQNVGTADKYIRVLLAIVIAILYFTDVISGTLAIILGIIGQNKDSNPSMAAGGLVLGIIDIVCGIVFLPFLFFPFFFFWP